MYVHVHVWATYVPGTCRGQKRVSDLLERELELLVNNYVEAENYTWVFKKSMYTHNC